MSSDIAILAIVGASGAGKTTVLEALRERRLPSVGCHNFDSIGVPSLDVMDRDFGGRGQSELATPRMDAWAAYLRGQADALGIAVYDTTSMEPASVADALAKLIDALRP